MTDGSPPSKTDTQLFVVPKSIPTTLAIYCSLYPYCLNLLKSPGASPAIAEFLLLSRSMSKD
jgi:hypothetical protein